MIILNITDCGYIYIDDDHNYYACIMTPECAYLRVPVELGPHFPLG